MQTANDDERLTALVVIFGEEFVDQYLQEQERDLGTLSDRTTVLLGQIPLGRLEGFIDGVIQSCKVTGTDALIMGDEFDTVRVKDENGLLTDLKLVRERDEQAH